MSRATPKTTSIWLKFIFNSEVFRSLHISRVSVNVSREIGRFRRREFQKYSEFSVENVVIARELASHSIQSRFIDRFDNIPNLVDTPLQTIGGYVVNTACGNHRQIFPQADGKVLFKNNNFWLFIDFNTDDGEDELPVVFEMSCWWNWLNLIASMSSRIR